MSAEHRRKILEMVEQGKITAEEACKLLDKLEHAPDGAKKAQDEEVCDNLENSVGELIESKLQRMNEVIQTVVNKASDFLQTGLENLNLGSHRETRTLSIPHQDHKPLKVTSRNGSIVVEQSQSGEVQIKAELSSTSPERLFETTIAAQRLEDGTLSIEVHWPDGKPKNREGCRLHLQLPNADGLNLTTSNGAIRVRDLSGICVLKTSNGAIHLANHAGPVEIRSSNAPVHLHKVSGEIQIDTSNGRIEADQIDGRIKAQTSNGSVLLRLADDAQGPVEVRTSNGTVDFQAGAAFNGELKLDTSNSAIKVEEASGIRIISLDRNSAHLAAGDATSAPECSTIKTSNAPIKVSFGRKH